MDFHGIDCKGELKLEIVASLPTPYDPSYERRILYNEADKKLYYGTDTEWIDLADAAHIAQTQAHGSDGDIVGATTLSNAITAHAASYNHPLATVSEPGFMPQLPNDPNLVLNGVGEWGTGDAVSKNINQTNHGFVVGDVIRLNRNTGLYVKAQSNNDENAEVIGVVTNVYDLHNFVITTSGFCDFYGESIFNISDPVYGYAGVYYLSATVAGKLQKDQPISGQISKPLFIAKNTSQGYFVNWRGIEVPEEAQGVDQTFKTKRISNNYTITVDDLFTTLVLDAPVTRNIHLPYNLEWINSWIKFICVGAGEWTFSGSSILGYNLYGPTGNGVVLKQTESLTLTIYENSAGLQSYWGVRNRTERPLGSIMLSEIYERNSSGQTIGTRATYSRNTWSTRIFNQVVVSNFQDIPYIYSNGSLTLYKGTYYVSASSIQNTGNDGRAAIRVKVNSNVQVRSISQQSHTDDDLATLSLHGFFHINTPSAVVTLEGFGDQWINWMDNYLVGQIDTQMCIVKLGEYN